MNDTKIGNFEAIALILTITFNHIILNITKSILDHTGSSSLLNILYISIIALIIVAFINFIFKKFPTYDLVDISEFLGGKILKWIIGILFVGYFVFFSSILLHILCSCLQVTSFSLTHLSYISSLFIIVAIFATTRKYNAIFRSNLLIAPIFIISFIFLFIANIRYYHVEKIYPVLGNGAFTTFISGICNLFAFQGIAYIYFLPPMLKEPSQIKKITMTSIIFSAIMLLISVALILFMFNGFVDTDEMMTLYSATKYVEFGSFFQRLDSTFLLIWIIVAISYLCITLKFCSNILKKLTNVKNDTFFIYALAIIIFIGTLLPKNYAISTFIANTVYKYAFFIIVLAISIVVLTLAAIKKKIVRRCSHEK